LRNVWIGCSLIGWPHIKPGLILACRNYLYNVRYKLWDNYTNIVRFSFHMLCCIESTEDVYVGKAKETAFS